MNADEAYRNARKIVTFVADTVFWLGIVLPLGIAYEVLALALSPAIVFGIMVGARTWTDFKTELKHVYVEIFVCMAVESMPEYSA